MRRSSVDLTIDGKAERVPPFAKKNHGQIKGIMRN
jgi:hypothetical protein